MVVRRDDSLSSVDALECIIRREGCGGEPGDHRTYGARAIAHAVVRPVAGCWDVRDARINGHGYLVVSEPSHRSWIGATRRESLRWRAGVGGRETLAGSMRMCRVYSRIVAGRLRESCPLVNRVRGGMSPARWSREWSGWYASSLGDVMCSLVAETGAVQAEFGMSQAGRRPVVVRHE